MIEDLQIIQNNSLFINGLEKYVPKLFAYFLYENSIFVKSEDMETLKIHTKNKDQLRAVKAILQVLKIPFESQPESPYNPDFVTKIKESEKQAQEGKIHRIKTEDLWK